MLAGRRSRDTPGPDNAPRNIGLDPRWGDNWRYIVSTAPQLREYVWDFGAEVYDMAMRTRLGHNYSRYIAGRRRKEPGTQNPFPKNPFWPGLPNDTPTDKASNA